MSYNIVQFFLPFTRYPYSGESVVCPACGHDDSQPLVSLDRRLKRLPTVMCGHCGLLYTNPMPTDAELTSYYRDYYRFDYQAATSKPKERHISKRRVEASRRVAQLEGLLPEGARTLDFGCGSGEFVGAMLDAGFDAHGFEPGDTYATYARTLYGDRISVSGWQDFKVETPFDLVTSFHVVEHLRDPVAAIRQMTQWIAPGGLIYIEIPDLGIVHPNKGFGTLHFAHLTGFNQHNLVVAAARAGLTPERTVSPTGVIFRREQMPAEAIEAEALRGRALAQRLYGGGRMVSNYLRYQLGKLTGANRAKD
ncbi:class I SAM-dependent methyltransferase [Hoeflea sp. YIM 152468]|uniref:class I SAM-dependent methyltransferase n=1 Tax=Hoeflea sp. YIM 152468 TaxID=3031759 RepID=UPI0023DCD054|nr:class I SAM-dependent methyltransferase [Hoeflea sp. YIM 152468]MDF1608323.1 class I SAM-dependent methyltransferase [Hoeflea sp. YIM 152468]